VLTGGTTAHFNTPLELLPHLTTVIARQVLNQNRFHCFH
jgi:hypothetical protein